MCASPAGVQIDTTFIWFSVSVPVLSVQMKVVAPSVSTDSSRRTRAFCPAIRCAPMASDRVTVGSSPSGTSATVTPIPKMNPSEAGTPRASIRAKNPTPTAPAMIAIIRTRCAMSRSSGVAGRGCWVSLAIPPSRVRAPVAATCAVTRPWTRKQPAKTSSPAVASRGALSPVSVEVSTRADWASRHVMSAVIRSPATSMTTSPGTIRSAVTCCSWPSRRTVAYTGSRSRRPAAACSARFSCTNANTPLTSTTATMAAPRAGIPPTSARAAATQSSSAKKCTNCLVRRRQTGTCSVRGSTFGPTRVRRSAAWALVSPGVRAGAVALTQSTLLPRGLLLQGPDGPPVRGSRAR